MLKGDKKTFEKLFADDYTAISPHVTKITKEQVIAVHFQKADAENKMEKVEFNELQVKIHGNTVIVTYLAEMGGLYNGANSINRRESPMFGQRTAINGSQSPVTPLL